jgi:putative cell wall-binding protein
MVAPDVTRARNPSIALGVALCLVALLFAVPAGAAPAVERISGADHFTTAAEISRAVFSPGVPVAYVATGGDYPDALAGAPAAAAGPGPVLLVDRDGIPDPTAQELGRLGAHRIVVLGGPTAVSTAVEAQLEAYTRGSVTRLAGDDRFATAAAVSRATFAPGAAVVHIAAGNNFPDALAASARGQPLLLVEANAIPAPTASELSRLQPRNVNILGGPDVISGEVEHQLQSFASDSVTRTAGIDRYHTAADVSASSYQPGTEAVFLATGLNYPDALAGAVMAARASGPLLLVPGTCLPEAANAEIDRLDPARLVILGGPDAVSPAVESRAVCPPPPPPPPPDRVVTEQAWTPFATVGGVTLVHPSARVERVGFHESNHDGARQLEPLPTAVAPVTMETRNRGTGSRSAADVVVDPGGEIRAPVTGSVKRSGSYVLYCDYSDDYVVVEPDDHVGWEVKILHIDGVQVVAGDRVTAGETVLAPRPRQLPFESQVDELRTAEPAWPHVHVEVVDPAIRDRPSGGGCN